MYEATLNDYLENDVSGALLAGHFSGTSLTYSPETDTHYAGGIEVIDKDICIVHNVDPDNAAEMANDDYGHTIWLYREDGATIIYVQSPEGDKVGIYPPNATIDDELNDWDFDFYGSYEDMYAAFDLEPPLSEADDDYVGPVKIWVTPNYYAGTCGAPKPSWVNDGNSPDPLIFDSYPDAKAWINDAESGTYYLSHGEAGRPTYTIVEA